MIGSAVVLFILVATILALRGVFGDYPAEWEWVGLVLAGASLVIGAPAVFQLIWGRPRLEVDFDVGAQGSERFLPVYFKNAPIENRVIKRLARRETIQSLTAQFRISEVGSGTVLIPNRQARIFSDDEPEANGGDRIPLPPTFSVGAGIVIARWGVEKKKAFVPESLVSKKYDLQEGYYHAEILLLVDGEPQNFTRRFVVGKNSDDLAWAPHSG